MKFEFQVEEAETECVFRVSHTDKYLHSFMRMKVVDRQQRVVDSVRDLTEAHTVNTLNTLTTQKMTFQPNDGAGYVLLVEGMMPFNVGEGTLSLDVFTNREALALEQVEQLDPLEYTDRFAPNKYGIVFKEKIFVGDTRVPPSTCRSSKPRKCQSSLSRPRARLQREQSPPSPQSQLSLKLAPRYRR